MKLLRAILEKQRLTRKKLAFVEYVPISCDLIKIIVIQPYSTLLLKRK